MRRLEENSQTQLCLVIELPSKSQLRTCEKNSPLPLCVAGYFFCAPLERVGRFQLIVFSGFISM